MKMKKKLAKIVCETFLFTILSAISAYAFDTSVFTSDSTYTVEMDDMDDTGKIFKNDPYFTVNANDGTNIEWCYDLLVNPTEGVANFGIVTYIGGISQYDKVIIKTEGYRYIFNLSNVGCSLSDDGNGLFINLFLFDRNAMFMLKDMATTDDDIQFRIVCSGKQVDGVITVNDKEALLDFYNDYDAAGGFNQEFFSKYYDAGYYLCDFTDLNAKAEEEVSNNDSVEVSYSDKLVIAIVQQALTNAGFDSGKSDGIIGNKTTTAITEYQKAKNLEVTGAISDELVESLGVESKVQTAAKKEASKVNYSTDVTYDQLSRNPDVYNGQLLKYRGKVLQDIEELNGTRGMRLMVNSDYENENVIYVFYPSDLIGYRILEGDQITVYGRSEGIYTYTSTMDVPISIPSISADILEIQY